MGGGMSELETREGQHCQAGNVKAFLHGGVWVGLICRKG